jgi:hypothetical protein
MKSFHSKYLEDLEHICSKEDVAEYYLWPRTPIGDGIQDKIIQRVGVSDYEVTHKRSRSGRIISYLNTLIQHHLLEPGFSLLDIACGDAVILWQIKKAFPEAHCFGIDCKKGKFSTHSKVQQEGVQLFNVFIQHLFMTCPEIPFDVVMMLNTYRGWESADLREHEQHLPELADKWFEKNARYTILTATDQQITHLRRLNFSVQKIGRGEDDSTLIGLSRLKLPKPFWKRVLSFYQ